MRSRLLAAASLGFVLVSTASACNMALPPGDVTSPHYWGDVFLDKYADELVLEELEPGPEPLEEPRVVLLITGVTIPAEWFDPMVARLERDGFIPVVYEPPDLLSGDLFENSELLGEVVDEIRGDYGVEKVDILAECTGGVIARHYIQSLGGDEKVSRMVTFISPQHGLPKAPLAASVVGWPALDDLTPGSEFLRAVNDAPLPQDVPITSIYSCTDEYIQPYATSIIPGATNIELCDEFVGHFQFFYDPEIYLVMHDALTQPLAADEGEGDEEDEQDDEDEKADGLGGADEPGDDADDVAGGCAVDRSHARGLGTWLLLGLGLVFGVRRRRR
jgi:MYXO-CTERM domain-containing protein